MADPTPDTGTPTPDQDPITPTPDDAAPDTGDSPVDEVDKWKSMARKWEKQAKQNSEAAQRLQEIEDAGRSELERAQQAAQDAIARADAAEAKARDQAIRASVVSAATRLGAVDPETVVRLIDSSDLEIGDDGTVTGAAEAVTALLEASPYLLGKPARPAPGSANGGPRGDKPAQWTHEDLKNHTSDEIAQAFKDGLLNDLRSG